MSLDTIANAVRQAVGDYGIYRSHIIPNGIINGINRRFQASARPLSSNNTNLYAGDGTEITTGFALNGDTGMLVYDTAPSNGFTHYLEGFVYRYPRTAILSAIECAGHWLRGVWGTDYVLVGTGESISFSPGEPVSNHYFLLVLSAAWQLITGRWISAAADSIRISDSGGMEDNTSRAPNLADVEKTLKARIEQLCSEMGYSSPRFPAQDDAGSYLGITEWQGPDGLTV